MQKCSEFYVMANGRRIDKALADNLFNHVNARIPSLVPNTLYSLKQIAGDEYWASLSTGEQRIGGVYISSMVDMEKLKLRNVLWKYQYPLKYQFTNIT